MIPACRWGVYGFRPSSYRPRRVFAEGDQHRMVTIPDPRQRHIPRAFPQCFAAAGGERTHSLALRACTRWRVPPTSTQREQVDRAFWSPRFRSLADPLACASSLYALARPPYKHAARASGSSVLGASFPVVSGPTRLRFELVRAGASPPTSTQREQVDRAFRSPRFRSLTDPLACASSLYALARPPTSTQREQVDRAFWAPRFGSLTDPLACASSLYALARSPYKHAARASGSSVLGASLPVLNGPTRLRFELVRAGASPPASTQREQVDRAFWSPRFRSLTDPLACASSLYALARPPASTQREQVDRAFRSLLRRGEAALECGNLLPLSGLQPPANTFRQFARPRSPNSDLRSPIPCVLVLEIVIIVVFPSVPSASSCSFSSLSSYWRQS